MTNQNTALREHEPPTEPERLRSSSSHILQKGDHQLEAASASHNNNNHNSTSAITPPVSIALKNSLNANPGLSVTSNHNSSGNYSPNSSHHSHKSSRDKRPASRGSQEVEGVRESAAASFSALFQPYNPVFSGNNTSGGTGGSGPERCHTTSPIGMHHQQRLISPTSPYFSSGSNRLMKSARDMHNMLHKRPLSADGGAAAASEAKRSTRLMMDRSMRLRSPSSMEQRRHDEDEAESETASDLRMATTDNDGEEESRLRDSKRNIKLLHNSSRDDDRPRSAQHLESGE